MKEKLKELTKDTAVYGISTIIGRLFGFILIPVLTHFFSTFQMGVYSNIYSYIAFLNIAYIYGMDAAFLKYTSVAEEKEKKDVFSTPFLIVTFTSTVYSILIFVFYAQIAELIKVPSDYIYLIKYVAVIIFFDTLAIIPFAHLRLQRKAMKFAIIKTINISIFLILSIVLIVIGDLDIDAIFISNTVASILTFLLLIPDILRFFKLRMRFEFAKKMLKFGVPYLPAALASTFVMMIDRPILTYLTDYETVGIYSANYKLGVAMMLFVGMFQYAWQPFFLNNAKEPNAKEIFAKVLTLVMIIGSVMVLSISLFVDDLVAIPLWKGKTLIDIKYWSGLKIVPIILASYLFTGVYFVLQAGLYIKEKTKYFPVITITAAVANIAVNFWLIPIYGIMGAAIATIVAYIIMAVMLYIIVQRFYYIKYENYKVLVILLMLFGSLGLFYILNWNDQINFLYKCMILIGYLGSLVLLGVIQKKEVITTLNMFRRKKV